MELVKRLNWQLLINRTLTIDVDIEEYLSVIVGKNNSGKTSLLLAMERFLSGGTNAHFELDDLNIDLQTHLVNLLDGKVEPADPFPMCGISLRLFIEYGTNDDLAAVGNKVIMDLDPDNKWIVMDFLYHLAQENLATMIRDFKAHKDKKGENAKNALDYLKKEHRAYFKIARRSLQFDHLTSTVQEDNYVDLIKENIRIEDIISFKRINARRSVSNRESDRGLSTMSSKIYSAMSADAGEDEVVETFKDALSDTDGKLNAVYANLFKEVIEDVRKFGGIKEGDTELQIKSTLMHRDMLEENTTVMYRHGDEHHVLPESYNGLGYLNLISIIFEIKILLNEFKRGGSPKPADINLLFIEEPEAHTHPQAVSANRVGARA
jgi:predicted ATP-dependent endonuclease of OLD family